MERYTLSDLIAEREAKANRQDGTLTISMVVTVPSYTKDSARSSIKHVTLARYHGVTVEESHELKDWFLKSNDELLPAFIVVKWEQCKYL